MQPRVKVNALTRFRHYNNLQVCASRLDKLLQDFRFGTVSQCLEENYGQFAELPSHSYD